MVIAYRFPNGVRALGNQQRFGKYVMTVYRLLTLITALASVLSGRVAAATTISDDLWLDKDKNYPTVAVMLDALDSDWHVILPAGELETMGYPPVRIGEDDKTVRWGIAETSDHDLAASAAATASRWLLLYRNSRPANDTAPVSLASDPPSGNATVAEAIAKFLRGSTAAAAYFDPGGSLSAHNILGNDNSERRWYSRTTTVALMGLGLVISALLVGVMSGPQRTINAYYAPRPVNPRMVDPSSSSRCLRRKPRRLFGFVRRQNARTLRKPSSPLLRSTG